MAEAAAIAGSVLNVGSTIYGATQEAHTLRENAKVDETNAHLALIDGASQAEGVRRRERATSGEATAALGANGTVVGTGSALDLITQNAVEREYDILGTRYQAASEAYSLRQSALQKRAAAKSTVIGGLLKAGAQALSSAGDLSSAGKVSNAEASSRNPALIAAGRTFPMRSGSLSIPGVYGGAY